MAISSILTPCHLRDLHFSRFFSFKKIFASTPPIKPTRMPTQKSKIWFSILSFREVGSSLVSFSMIFQVLQSEILRIEFHSLRSKILKTRDSSNSLMVLSPEAKVKLKNITICEHSFS